MGTTEVILSRRQWQVLGLIALGMDDRQMAGELGLEMHTVKTHVIRARARLGARTRAEAVAIVLCGLAGHAHGLPATPQPVTVPRADPTPR